MTLIVGATCLVILENIIYIDDQSLKMYVTKGWKIPRATSVYLDCISSQTVSQIYQVQSRICLFPSNKFTKIEKFILTA